MASLAILHPDARASARLSETLGSAHRVTVRRSWEALDRLLARGEVEGCLVDADHPDRGAAAGEVARLRAQYPGVAFIAYVDAGRAEGFFDLGGLGVEGVVTSDTPRTRLRTEVDQAFSVARGERVARELAARFPAPGPDAVAWAVAHASHETSVHKLAASLGYTPRTLRDSLGAIGLPPPARILAWGRLLLAGARLERDGRTVEEVAFSVGYATSTSLARAMKLHTGLTPHQVSKRGGIEAVRDALVSP